MPSRRRHRPSSPPSSLSLARPGRTGAMLLLTLGLAGRAAGQSQHEAPPQAQRPQPAAAAEDDRWRETLEAFASADLRQAPQPGGVLFVGSSSIRLWNDLETSFEGQPVVIKRGFGGSRLADCAQLANRLVLPYKPRLVVVYAGDNDLSEGATPQEVLERYVSFVRQVRAELPDSRIAYISIKPSPLRSALLAKVREANALISDYSRTQPGLGYIDVHSAMLDGQGQPRAELFLADRLHLNLQGYALWKQLIAAHLKG